MFRTAGLAAVPAFLVFLQPDLGTSIVFVAILVGMLVVAGARARYLGVLALTAVVLIVAGFQVGLVREYQIERLRGFLDPASVSEDALHNREQAEIAIGSGGLTGVGYLQGSQTNLDFVPEQHTDFVFTVVGEEFGFAGAATCWRCTASCSGGRSGWRCSRGTRSGPIWRRGSHRCSRYRCS